jgi:hypothetical protein
MNSCVNLTASVDGVALAAFQLLSISPVNRLWRSDNIASALLRDHLGLPVNGAHAQHIDVAIVAAGYLYRPDAVVTPGGLAKRHP